MKKIMIALAFATASSFALMSVGTEAQQVQTPQVQSKTTIQGKAAPEHSVMVPSGQTYVKLDRSNKAMATFGAGQRMGVLNCAQVPCPSTFKPGTVCWKCEESASLQMK